MEPFRSTCESLDCAYHVVDKADICLEADTYLTACDLEAGV